MTNTSNIVNEEGRDELLLLSLMDLVPNAALTAALVSAIRETPELDDQIADLLLAYGTLLNVIQAASELDGTLYDRLSAGYYELTNNDDPGDTEIRLTDD